MGLREDQRAPLGGVVYDLDGTLVDSRDDLADSVNAMLARLGLPQRDPVVIYGFIGEGAERLIRRSLGPTHEERYPEAAPLWREEYGKRLLARTRLYPGVADLLRRPPDARAVLTNKPGGLPRGGRWRRRPAKAGAGRPAGPLRCPGARACAGAAGRRQRRRSGHRQGGGRSRLRRDLGAGGACGARLRRLSL